MASPKTSDVDKVAMGRRIGEALEMAGMTAAQLNREMQLGANAVWRWVNGKTEPSAAHLSQIARILGRTADWYLYGQDAEATPTTEFRGVWAEFKASRAYQRITPVQRWQLSRLEWPRGTAPTLEYLLELTRADAAAMVDDTVEPHGIDEDA